MNKLISKVGLNLCSLYRLKKEDALIVSYPKVGSTWIRYFLFLMYKNQFEAEQPTIDSMNFYMPEFGNKSILNPWYFDKYIKVVKTHKVRHFYFNQKKVIYIIRDPRETMVSYFHYLKGKKALKFDRNFSSLLKSKKYGLEPYIKHYKSWEKHIGLLVKYESLKSNPFKAFKAIIEFLEMEQSDELIKRGIEGANFNNMKNVQNKSPELAQQFQGGYQFIRSGSSNEWKELFTDQDLIFLKTVTEKYSFNLYDFKI